MGRPLLSPDIFKKKVIPQVDSGNKVFVLVIDNLRYDQYPRFGNCAQQLLPC